MRLGIANLLHNFNRTVLSLAGIGFAIVLIFMQMGFRGSVATTATLIYSKLKFDLIIRSPDYLHFCDARYIERDRLYELASLPGVEQVVPFQVMLHYWQIPDNEWTRRSDIAGETRGVIAMATDPHADVFKVGEIRMKMHRLTTNESILMDRKSRAEYGPANGTEFSDADIGVIAEVAGRQVQITETIELGTGLAANGAFLTTLEGFQRITPEMGQNNVSFGLIRVRRGEKPREVRRRINAFLLENFGEHPPYEVLSRPEVMLRELKRWLRDTPIGAIFTMGVVVAFMVGAAIFYMILSNDVANQIGEYATLLAMGYTQRFLSGVVLVQAVSLAVLAFLPAWLLSEILYRITSQAAGIPITMTGTRPLYVFALSVLMCFVSGLGALRKLRQADPADLF
ncbi:MAG: FtsX-like permease family protein [Planctomycetales bacterium]|nr:FtsX-like permease family protein [Planctomycetales bacterium]